MVLLYCRVAKLVRRRTLDAEILGSSPSPAACKVNLKKSLTRRFFDRIGK